LQVVRKGGEGMSTFQEDTAHLMRDLHTEHQINGLKAENEKLRERMRDAEYEDELYGLRCAIGALQAENDKLRELVRDFYPFASGRAANPWLSVRLERMRELGV
jgi:hypothetical protein